MRKLLNTLYVTTPEAYLSKDGLNVVISVQQEEVFRIPVINIEGIVTFGYMGASPGVMKLCSDNGISLTFLSPQGRFISRVQGATKGNVLRYRVTPCVGVWIETPSTTWRRYLHMVTPCVGVYGLKHCSLVGQVYGRIVSIRPLVYFSSSCYKVKSQTKYVRLLTLL